MQNSGRIVKLLGLCALVPGLVLALSAKNAAPKVYFLEFEASTYSPVNEGRLTQCYNMSSLLESRHGELRAVLDRKGPGATFDHSVVRLSVSYQKEPTILVDRNGSVQVGDRIYSLDPKAFKDLKTLLWSVTPKVQLPK